jgi:uncharacterized protein (TIGR03032 family)
MSLKSKDSHAPFQCQYDPAFAEMLYKMRATLAISTYQAGKLIFLSSPSPGKLIQLPRTFKKPMGVALKGNESLGLALGDSVMVFRNSRDLAYHYPKKPKTYDSLYMPGAKYYTSALDIHDIDWVGDRLHAVNTHFSCIISIGQDYSFVPVWHPPFLDRPVPGDVCHLNGMAVENGKIKYATAFGKGTKRQSWRDGITSSGIVMDVQSNKIVVEGLGMPHSPRVYQGELHLLLSATGQLVKVDTGSGVVEEVVNLESFVRGLCFYQDVAFIGHSRLRKESSTFSKLDLPGKDHLAGITAVHLGSGSIIGRLRYLSSVDEIYDVQIIQNTMRPNILNTDKPEYIRGITTPETTFWGVDPKDGHRDNP